MLNMGDLMTSISRFIRDNAYVLDGLKFFLAGIFFDLSRRLSDKVYDAIHDCTTLTATIPEEDPAFSWLKYYLITNLIPLTVKPSLLQDFKESLWASGAAPARRITLASNKPWTSLTDDLHDATPPWMKKVDVTHKHDRVIYAYPSLQHVQSFRYRGHTMRFVVAQKNDLGMIIETSGRSRSIFTQLLQDARTAYMATGNGRLSVYEPRPFTSHYGSEWQLTTSRPIRPLSSIILPEGLKEDVLADVKEFLNEREFYKNRGVPYRRGWLLYGVPGSGKTSLIGALASELDLDIYFINLGSQGIDDMRLQVLFRAAPEKCIVVIEDIDCTMKKRRSNPEKSQPERSADAAEDDDADSKTHSSISESSESESGPKRDSKGRRTDVTLSGLLNAIDGVASSEGRLLFCTTHSIEDIDEALIRPGRCDVRVEFKYTTRPQATQLFAHFYAVLPPRSSTVLTSLPPLDEKAKLNLPPTPAATPKIGSQGDDDIRVMGEEFGDRLPEGKVSVSAIQGYLMRHKRNPEQALRCLSDCIESNFDQAPAKSLQSRDFCQLQTTTGLM